MELGHESNDEKYNVNLVLTKCSELLNFQVIYAENI